MLRAGTLYILYVSIYANFGKPTFRSLRVQLMYFCKCRSLKPAIGLMPPVSVKQHLLLVFCDIKLSAILETMMIHALSISLFHLIYLEIFFSPFFSYQILKICPLKCMGMGSPVSYITLLYIIALFLVSIVHNFR